MTNNLCLPALDRLDSYPDAVECLPPTPGLMIKLIELFGQPERDVDGSHCEPGQSDGPLH